MKRLRASAMKMKVKDGKSNSQEFLGRTEVKDGNADGKSKMGRKLAADGRS